MKKPEYTVTFPRTLSADNMDYGKACIYATELRPATQIEIEKYEIKDLWRICYDPRRSSIKWGTALYLDKGSRIVKDGITYTFVDFHELAEKIENGKLEDILEILEDLE